MCVNTPNVLAYMLHLSTMKLVLNNLYSTKKLKKKLNSVAWVGERIYSTIYKNNKNMFKIQWKLFITEWTRLSAYSLFRCLKTTMYLRDQWFKMQECCVSTSAHLICVQKPQEALNPLVTEEHYWALFYMPVYTLFTQFAECTSTDYKENGITKKKKLLTCEDKKAILHTYTVKPQT
jgi:hypothetical protein